MMVATPKRWRTCATWTPSRGPPRSWTLSSTRGGCGRTSGTRSYRTPSCRCISENYSLVTFLCVGLFLREDSGKIQINGQGNALSILKELHTWSKFSNDQDQNREEFLPWFPSWFVITDWFVNFKHEKPKAEFFHQFIRSQLEHFSNQSRNWRNSMSPICLPSFELLTIHCSMLLTILKYLNSIKFSIVWWRLQLHWFWSNHKVLLVIPTNVGKSYQVKWSSPQSWSNPVDLMENFKEHNCVNCFRCTFSPFQI